MGTLRLGIQIRDFDLDRVGFALHVLGRDRHDGSGGYLRMTLEDLSRFIAALQAAEDVDLVAIEPERDDNYPESIAEEGPTDTAEPEPSRTADVIAFPWLSKVWRNASGGRSSTQASADGLAARQLTGLNTGHGPMKIRVLRSELRQPALF